MRNEVISDFLQWIPSHGHANVGRPETYLQQLCTDTGWSVENLQETMNDRDKWQESEKSVLAAWHDDDVYNI